MSCRARTLCDVGSCSRPCGQGRRGPSECRSSEPVGAKTSLTKGVRQKTAADAAGAQARLAPTNSSTMPRKALITLSLRRSIRLITCSLYSTRARIGETPCTARSSTGLWCSGRQLSSDQEADLVGTVEAFGRSVKRPHSPSKDWRRLCFGATVVDGRGGGGWHGWVATNSRNSGCGGAIWR